MHAHAITMQLLTSLAIPMAICAQYQSTQDTQWEAPLKDFNNQAPEINPLVAMPWLFTSKYVQHNV